jgi:hypothetical protein
MTSQFGELYFTLYYAYAKQNTNKFLANFNFTTVFIHFMEIVVNMRHGKAFYF